MHNAIQTKSGMLENTENQVPCITIHLFTYFEQGSCCVALAGLD